MSSYQNPFPPADADRHALWTMLVERDIEAFMAQDWNLIADDFVTTDFTAIDANGSFNPDSWRLTYPTLDDYRRVWLEQARKLNERCAPDMLREAVYAATTLSDIEVKGSTALLHKKFEGQVFARDGEQIPLRWQTVYHCIKLNGQWKITGFVGYLPGGAVPSAVGEFVGKRVPEGATQHKTAGPYSPVLVVHPGKLVVISGQAAIDQDGNVVGNTIEAQARKTLENCLGQLGAAGCSFRDVFKVNVYLTDLANWSAFNGVYSAIMPDPKPVRTAVETRLLPGLLVEIEMWAMTS